MFYSFKTKIWDTDETAEKLYTGIVHGKNYGKAAMNLIDYFGADYVIDIYLQELDAENVMTSDFAKDAFIV